MIFVMGNDDVVHGLGVPVLTGGLLRLRTGTTQRQRSRTLQTRTMEAMPDQTMTEINPRLNKYPQMLSILLIPNILSCIMYPPPYF